MIEIIIINGMLTVIIVVFKKSSYETGFTVKKNLSKRYNESSDFFFSSCFHFVFFSLRLHLEFTSFHRLFLEVIS